MKCWWYRQFWANSGRENDFLKVPDARLRGDIEIGHSINGEREFLKHLKMGWSLTRHFEPTRVNYLVVKNVYREQVPKFLF